MKYDGLKQKKSNSIANALGLNYTIFVSYSGNQTVVIDQSMLKWWEQFIISV